MQNVRCHVCKLKGFLVIMKSGHNVCPLCFSNFYFHYPLIPIDLESRCIPADFINVYDTIEKITTDLMSIFLHQGMTVSNLARQMGITRSTIYSRMKKYNRLDLESREDCTVEMTETDIQNCGGLKHVAHQKGVTVKET